ncbi:MAG: hypothetical protein L0241_10970 [Planctomycetia bacterium]|nr:hypothetical protein [Planctomycetia bacterium]
MDAPFHDRSSRSFGPDIAITSERFVRFAIRRNFQGKAMSKAQIIGELGERALLLPALVNEGLTANDRAKYRMTLLQSAREHADHPHRKTSDLKRERLAANEPDAELDAVVNRSRKEDRDTYSIHRGRQICEALVEDVRRMLAPLRAIGNGEARNKHTATDYEKRLNAILAQTPPPANDHISRTTIDRLTSGSRTEGDSLHLLVMDLHKELNKLQKRLATETIAGASVYGIEDEDRPLIAAFMAGLNRTRELKFDHPGLGTTATRSNGRLVIQNDIGVTAAHVLVIHVEADRVTLTYTDVHIERVLFFQSLFERFAVHWQDTVSKRAAGLGEDLYHLCLGTYTAQSPAERLAYLTHLGSRLVFLIDWNRARKRLRKFAKRRVCLSVLRWAADNDYGHMAFLVLGGDQLIFDALRTAGRLSLPPAGLLSDILGPERTAEFLKFTLQTASEGLREGRSEFLIRDEISAELRHYIDTAHQGLLASASEQASLAVELATAAGDLLGPSGSDRDFVKRTVKRARKWEHQADEIVRRTRGSRGEDSAPIINLLIHADDIADALEDAIYRLSLLLANDPPAPSAALSELAGLVVEGAREYLKAVENARCLHRGSSREQVEDFLHAVDRVLKVEHQSDDAHRQAQAEVLDFTGDFKQWHLTSRVADKFEEAADAMLRVALLLRDYILSEVLRR